MPTVTVAKEGSSVPVSTYTDSSDPILWPPSSTTSWPRHSRISPASNIMILLSSLPPFYPASPSSSGQIARIAEMPEAPEFRVDSASGSGRLDVHDRAGQGPGDPGDTLDLGDHELPEVIHAVRFGPDDHVVRPGDVLGEGHPLDAPDAASDVGGFTHLGLHEDVCLNHASSPGGIIAFGRNGYATLNSKTAAGRPPSPSRTWANSG